MAGKRYYITTMSCWRRHAARFANSHYVALADTTADSAPDAAADDARVLPAEIATKVAQEEATDGASDVATEAATHGRGEEATSGAVKVATKGAFVNDAKILVLVEADEGAHLALEDDSACEALPHPLAQKPISESAQAALACHGVAPGATTFDAAEAVARVHPLLRHRVF
jgi:hypothetical protein